MVTENDAIEGATDARTDEGSDTTAAGQSSPESDPNQEKTVGEGTENSPQPDKAKGKAAAGKNAVGKPQADPPKKDPPPTVEKPKRVRVICEGTLGPLLLKKNEETEDPAYVALLHEKGQKKVELVK